MSQTSSDKLLSSYRDRMNFVLVCQICEEELDGARFFQKEFGNETDDMIVKATNLAAFEMLVISLRNHLRLDHYVKFPE